MTAQQRLQHTQTLAQAMLQSAKQLVLGARAPAAHAGGVERVVAKVGAHIRHQPRRALARLVRLGSARVLQAREPYLRKPWPADGRITDELTLECHTCTFCPKQVLEGSSKAWLCWMQ